MQKLRYGTNYSVLLLSQVMRSLLVIVLISLHETKSLEASQGAMWGMECRAGVRRKNDVFDVANQGHTLIPGYAGSELGPPLSPHGYTGRARRSTFHQGQQSNANLMLQGVHGYERAVFHMLIGWWFSQPQNLQEQGNIIRAILYAVMWKKSGWITR